MPEMMGHTNITITFVVENDQSIDQRANIARFLSILDRVMPADETMTAPRRTGGDDGTLYIDTWLFARASNNRGETVALPDHDEGGNAFTVAEEGDVWDDERIEALRDFVQPRLATHVDQATYEFFMGEVAALLDSIAPRAKDGNRCAECGRDVLDTEACPNAHDLCLDCCGEDH